MTILMSSVIQTKYLQPKMEPKRSRFNSLYRKLFRTNCKCQLIKERNEKLQRKDLFEWCEQNLKAEYFNIIIIIVVSFGLMR